MIKIEMQERDLQIYLQEQANLAAKQNQAIIDCNVRLSNANAALTEEQRRHRVTNDKIYSLEQQVHDHTRTIERHKSSALNVEEQHKISIEAAKKAPPDASLVAVELQDLLKNLLGGKPNKIDAIKVIRSLTGWGLAESKNLYEGVESSLAKSKAA